MFQKNMRTAFLLDFYRDVLDEHAASIMQAYYEDDLSLAEIADDVGISRQGVRHIIKKSEEQIEFLEEKLMLSCRFSKIKSSLDELDSIAARLKLHNGAEFSEIADNIISITKKIAEENL